MCSLVQQKKKKVKKRPVAQTHSLMEQKRKRAKKYPPVETQKFKFESEELMKGHLAPISLCTVSLNDNGLDTSVMGGLPNLIMYFIYIILQDNYISF